MINEDTAIFLENVAALLKNDMVAINVYTIYFYENLLFIDLFIFER